MRHILSSGLVAGLAAGLLCALLQFVLVQPDIVLSEQYESGELVHFQGVVAGGSGHSHDHAAADAGQGDAAPAEATAEAGHDHHQDAGEEMSPAKRHGLTVLFAVMTYAGYGLLLAGAMAMAGQFGRSLSRAEAILWGLAGFMAFQMLPALGMAPELPGTPNADLNARQVWWAGTAIATVAGLGLLAYGTGWLYRLLGAALLALPHVIGAPELDAFGGVAPPELASRFAARSLGVGLITWAALGLAVHSLWHSERA